MPRSRKNATITGGAVLLLALLAVLAVMLPGDPEAVPETPDEKPLLRPKAVAGLHITHIVDGDTADLSTGERIRYIGIDTPERNQPFYDEAKQLNARLVEGRVVRVERDVDEKDKYGRLLGYIHAVDESGNEVFVNGEIVRNGLAYVYTVPPNVKYADRLLALQREAREQNRGFWARPVKEESHYAGSKKSTVFHRPDCESLEKMNPKNKVRYDDRGAALDVGKSPCRRCQP